MAPLMDRVLPASATSAFCAKWGVSELYVFGSAARGELRDDSDLDVAVRFRQLVATLGPYGDRVVIVGGRAHRLFRHHPLGQPPTLTS